MRKKIRFYKQHSMETCGSACMLMLLDLYGKIEYPTPKQEMKLYSLYRSRAFRGVNGAAIANCLSKNGLNVHLAHSSAEMMDNRDGYFPEELFCDLMDEYREEVRKCENRITVRTGAEITCDTIRLELDGGRQIILEYLIPGDADGMHDHVLHWVVVYTSTDVCVNSENMITIHFGIHQIGQHIIEFTGDMVAFLGVGVAVRNR